MRRFLTHYVDTHLYRTPWTPAPSVVSSDQEQTHSDDPPDYGPQIASYAIAVITQPKCLLPISVAGKTIYRVWPDPEVELHMHDAAGNRIFQYDQEICSTLISCFLEGPNKERLSAQTGHIISESGSWRIRYTFSGLRVTARTSNPELVHLKFSASAPYPGGGCIKDISSEAFSVSV